VGVGGRVKLQVLAYLIAVPWRHREYSPQNPNHRPCCARSRHAAEMKAHQHGQGERSVARVGTRMFNKILTNMT